MQQLWVDHYRPRQFQKLTYHPEISSILSELADTDSFPHMIVYGPEGAGKKTRVYAFLQKLFGSQVFKLKNEQRQLKVESSGTVIEYSLLSSSQHIQMTPSDNQHQDRLIIQHVVKTIAENSNLEGRSGKNYKVLLVNQADRLTREAQGGLRRTMEKYVDNCRMILLCTRLERVIAPIRSRCLNVRVPAPKVDDITLVLQAVALEQSKNYSNFSFSQQMILGVAHNCGRNLRLALLQLQALKYNKSSEISFLPYQKQIRDIVVMLVKEQSPAQIKRIRDMCYDLLVNCVEGFTILKEMVLGLIAEFTAKQGQKGSNQLKEETLKELISIGAQHERSMMCGSKVIYHLESFVAHAMQVISNAQQ